jgi:hypothetical protein
MRAQYVIVTCAVLVLPVGGLSVPAFAFATLSILVLFPEAQPIEVSLT